jgi:hypothetical protein
VHIPEFFGRSSFRHSWSFSATHKRYAFSMKAAS